MIRSNVRTTRGIGASCFARDKFKQELQERQCKADSKRQSVNPMPWLGELRLSSSSVLSLLPHPVRGGAVVRRCPGPYRSLSIPIRVVPPARASWLGVWGRTAVRLHVCEFVLGSSALVFSRPFFGLRAGSKKKTSRALVCGMASKARSSKGGEELVGQELARSLWAQGLSEPEAGCKQS